MKNVLVLGAGKMVEAVLQGLKKNHDLSTWQIYSPTGVSSKKLAQKIGAKCVTCISGQLRPSWILIGCKPQQIRELALTLGGEFKDVLYVSLLAAVSEADQRRILGVNRLLRLMPGLSVEYQSGVSLLSSVSAAQELQKFQEDFSSLGTSVIVSEEELDELTLLTASGPALFYEFSKNLFEAFDSLDASAREALVRQVLTGVGISAHKSSALLDTMINNVTSKAGVTIAVLQRWRDLNLKDLIKQGIQAGKIRTLEIKEQFRD